MHTGTEQSDGQTPAQRLAHLVPIGVAAKRLQDGLTAFVDGLFEERFGLRRRHWQLLRWVHEHDEPALETFVAEAALFYTAEETRKVADDLLTRGWLGRRAGSGEAVLELTAEGERGFRAMAAAQDTTWQVVLQGQTEQDYVHAVHAMTVMADNLDRALTERETLR
ncbi:hypothetical protein [Amycolatopsis ultiminotia]